VGRNSPHPDVDNVVQSGALTGPRGSAARRYGTGPATLPTFTWAPNDMLYIADGCGSGSVGDSVTFAGDNSTFDGDFVNGQCSGPVTLDGGSGTSGGAGGPVSLTVKAGASLKWAVFIYEAPPGLLGPAP